jgi:hypothetical protein
MKLWREKICEKTLFGKINLIMRLNKKGADPITEVKE